MKIDRLKNTPKLPLKRLNEDHNFRQYRCSITKDKNTQFAKSYCIWLILKFHKTQEKVRKPPAIDNNFPASIIRNNLCTNGKNDLKVTEFREKRKEQNIVAVTGDATHW